MHKLTHTNRILSNTAAEKTCTQNIQNWRLKGQNAKNFFLKDQVYRLRFVGVFLGGTFTGWHYCKTSKKKGNKTTKTWKKNNVKNADINTHLLTNDQKWGNVSMWARKNLKQRWLTNCGNFPQNATKNCLILKASILLIKINQVLLTSISSKKPRIRCSFTS